MRTASGKGNGGRKILSYYRVNFGAHPPYRVLVDGPTIHQSFRAELFLKHSLPVLFDAPAYPVVTACIVHELRGLGEDFSAAALFAKRAQRIPCAHGEEPVPAADCVVSVVAARSGGLVLATNDGDIMKRVAKFPGVPLVNIANQTKLVLRPPSQATLKAVEERELQKTTQVLSSDKALVDKLAEERKAARDARHPLRKKKRPKGPNPLSVKKSKKAKETKHPTAGGAQSANAGDSEGAKTPTIQPPPCSPVRADETATELTPVVAELPHNARDVPRCSALRADETATQSELGVVDVPPPPLDFEAASVPAAGAATGSEASVEKIIACPGKRRRRRGSSRTAITADGDTIVEKLNENGATEKESSAQLPAKKRRKRRKSRASDAKAEIQDIGERSTEPVQAGQPDNSPAAFTEEDAVASLSPEKEAQPNASMCAKKRHISERSVHAKSVLTPKRIDSAARDDTVETTRERDRATAIKSQVPTSGELEAGTDIVQHRNDRASASLKPDVTGTLPISAGTPLNGESLGACTPRDVSLPLRKGSQCQTPLLKADEGTADGLTMAKAASDNVTVGASDNVTVGASDNVTVGASDGAGQNNESKKKKQRKNRRRRPAKAADKEVSNAALC